MEDALTGMGVLMFLPFLIIILNIILFFKIWGMTNDILRIRILFEKLNDRQEGKSHTSEKEASPASEPTTDNSSNLEST